MFKAYVYNLGFSRTGWTLKDGFKTEQEALMWVKVMWKKHNNGRPSRYEIKGVRDE